MRWKSPTAGAAASPILMPARQRISGAIGGQRSAFPSATSIMRAISRSPAMRRTNSLLALTCPAGGTYAPTPMRSGQGQNWHGTTKRPRRAASGSPSRPGAMASAPSMPTASGTGGVACGRPAMCRSHLCELSGIAKPRFWRKAT